jgi:hypothetical protein
MRWSGLKAHRNSRSAHAIRKRSALDWAAHLVEENGKELAESFLSAARNGDWRAAEALMSRIYGKPEETVRQVETNPAQAHGPRLDGARRRGARARDRRGLSASDAQGRLARFAG